TVAENLARVEKAVGRKFGDAGKPLLVSVRSGARASMPGMMDTILNLGLNDETVKGLAKHDERFALDSYRRFIQMYSDVVLEIDREKFEHELVTIREATGEKRLFGEYLPNAQGEDVVAGIRTPLPITELQKAMPQVYAQFVEVTQKLENHYRDMQDIEFTIESGKLYLLQTRTGKRTGFAAVKIACDMVDEGLINH